MSLTTLMVGNAALQAAYTVSGRPSGPADQVAAQWSPLLDAPAQLGALTLLAPQPAIEPAVLEVPGAREAETHAGRAPAIARPGDESADLVLASLAPLEARAGRPGPPVAAEPDVPLTAGLAPLRLEDTPPPFPGPSPDEIVTALAELPAFDHRPQPWLGPPPDGIGDMLPALPGMDRLPMPWLGLRHEEVIAMLPAMPPLATREPPYLAPAPLLEPHMEASEDWLIKTWLHRNPGIQRVRFMPNVQARCLPSALLRVLYDAAMRFGEVRVISGYRSPGHNRRVGGASRSLHMECRAIDFYIPGPAHGVISFLTARKEVGGYKRYPFGSYHIDNGPRRTWGWPGRRRGKGVAVASARTKSTATVQTTSQ